MSVRWLSFSLPSADFSMCDLDGARGVVGSGYVFASQPFLADHSGENGAETWWRNGAFLRGQASLRAELPRSRHGEAVLPAHLEFVFVGSSSMRAR